MIRPPRRRACAPGEGGQKTLPLPPVLVIAAVAGEVALPVTPMAMLLDFTMTA